MMKINLWVQRTQPLCAAVLILYSVGGLLPAAAERAPADPEAYRLMTRAVNARAVWDEEFPGFSADIKVNYEGQVYRGKVQVLPDGSIKLTDLFKPHSRAWTWAREWLGEMVFHRMAAQGSDDQYRGIRMTRGRNHPLGPMLVLNDPFNSSFRVDGKAIRQVNRDLQAEEGVERVRINVLDIAVTSEGKVLPIHYVNNYLNKKQELVAVEAVSSRFRRLDGYELPQWRRVITTEDEKMIVGELSLSNYHLHQPSSGIASTKH
jgi:hypothetical protein